MMTETPATNGKPTSPEKLLRHESTHLAQLIAAREAISQPKPFVVLNRDGTEMLRFTIRPLSEREFAAAEDEATTYTVEPDTGAKIPVKVNYPRYHALTIVRATVEQGFWSDPAALAHFKANMPEDLVETLLPSGHKRRAFREIELLSGYGALPVARVEEIAGN